jgi:hypothetical protein
MTKYYGKILMHETNLSCCLKSETMDEAQKELENISDEYINWKFLQIFVDAPNPHTKEHKYVCLRSRSLFSAWNNYRYVDEKMRF